MDTLTQISERLSHVSQVSLLFEVETLASRSLIAGEDLGGQRFRISPVEPGGRPFELIVAARSRLSPQEALGLLPRLSQRSGAAVRAVYSPVISPRVARMCREASVSYFDADGNAFLRGPGLLVHIMGNPRQTRPAAQADPFAPKSSRIIRQLLSAPGRTWGVLELAAVAGVSNGLASRIKEVLVREAYLQESHEGLRVRRPIELLGAWKAKYQPPEPVRLCYMMGTPQEAETRLIDWCQEHGYGSGLAGFSGANRVAPMVRYNRATVYVDACGKPGLFDQLRRDLELKEVASGANLALVLVGDPAIFAGARLVGQATVLSPLQLYLDLSKVAGRGMEAAEEVFQREIREIFDQAEEH